MSPKNPGKGEEAKFERGEKVEEIEEILKNIAVSIDGIQNVKGVFKNTKIFMQVEFMNKVISESLPQRLTHDIFVPHFFDSVFTFNSNDYKFLDDLISNPLLFTVYQFEETQDDENEFEKAITRNEPSSSSSDWGSGVSSGSRISKRSIERLPSKNSNTEGLQDDELIEMSNMFIMGRCNLDLLPLFCGHKEMFETLILEQELVTLDDEMVVYPNLPRLLLHVSIDRLLIDYEIREVSNTLYFCTESVYNLTDTMEEDMYFTVATVMPLNNGDLDVILIRDGVVTEKINRDEAKMWPGLAGLSNRSSYTKLKLPKDDSSIKCPLKIDVGKVIRSEARHLEWNIHRRFWIPNDGQELMKNNLKTFRRWPLEIHGTKKFNPTLIRPTVGNIAKGMFEMKVEASERPTVPKVGVGDIHLMGFLDLTNLLYPGVSRTRIACPLRTYNKNEMFNETGYEKTIFEDAPKEDELSQSKKDLKKKEEKAKKDKKTPPSLPEPEVEPDPSVQVFSKENEPTFIVIEVGVTKPFFKKRPLECLTNAVSKLIPDMEPLPQCEYDAGLAEGKYRNVIQQLVTEIQREYEGYQKNKFKEIVPDLNETENDFMFQLKKTGAFYSMKSSLLKSVLPLAKSKFIFKGNEQDPDDCSDYKSKVSAYLVAEMKTKLDSLFQKSSKTIEIKKIGDKELLYFAKEAEEMGDFETAERYFLERINLDIYNPNFWLDYAIFNIDHDKDHEALEICKEALNLDRKHKYGLILYATLLMKDKKYTEVEKVLLILTSCNCNFLEGWITLHLFYLKNDILEGSNLAYQMALRCLREFKADVQTIDDEFVSFDEFTWNSAMFNEEQMYVRTAVIHLKLRSFDFVEMALAKDLTENPSTTSYSYYFGVAFFLETKYAESREYMKDALKIYGLDINVGGLLGHCFYEMGDFDKAIECYEAVICTYDTGDHAHLIHTRQGNCYKSYNFNQKALDMFLLNCKYSPTPRSWLEAGKVLWDMGEFKEAQQCFVEANFLDSHLPDIWGYLALASKKFGYIKHYENCLNEAIKNGLKNEELAVKLGIVLETGNADGTDEKTKKKVEFQML